MIVKLRVIFGNLSFKLPVGTGAAQPAVTIFHGPHSHHNGERRHTAAGRRSSGHQIRIQSRGYDDKLVSIIVRCYSHYLKSKRQQRFSLSDYQ